MSRVCALRQQTSAQDSAILQTRDRITVSNVLKPATHLEPATRFSNISDKVIFTQCRDQRICPVLSQDKSKLKGM